MGVLTLSQGPGTPCSCSSHQWGLWCLCPLCMGGAGVWLGRKELIGKIFNNSNSNNNINNNNNNNEKNEKIYKKRNKMKINNNNNSKIKISCNNENNKIDRSDGFVIWNLLKKEWNFKSMNCS